MHPSAVALLRHFDFGHLPPELQEVSRPFGELAATVAARTSGAETTTCLRKLLEAKDCAVRAHLTETPAAAILAAERTGADRQQRTPPHGDPRR